MSTKTSIKQLDMVPGALPLAISDEERLRRQLLQVLLSPVEPHKMTYEEFLTWADEDTLAEWVDGEVMRKHFGLKHVITVPNGSDL